MLILGKRRKDALGRALLEFLHDPAGALGGFRLDQQVKMVRHEDPTDQQKSHLGAKPPEDLNEDPAQRRAALCASHAVTLEESRTAISAAGEELKLPRCKMALEGRHVQR